MTLHHGDCIEAMAGMEPESVDAVVTDPPYNIGFMGRAWDMNHGHGPWAEAAYRVAKPGAHLLAFGGTRTYHRLAAAIEDAGWEIRDCLVWGYASGFPKSKASLKPAWEPIVMARKPGPLRMLNIDECRIPHNEEAHYGTPQNDTAVMTRGAQAAAGYRPDGQPYSGEAEWKTNRLLSAAPAGRWPANIVLTDPIFDGGIEGVVGGGEEYSRFFVLPKADRADREPVLGGLPERERSGDSTWYRICRQCGERFVDPNTGMPKCGHDDRGWVTGKPRQNVHPTVKPTDLMRHLVRLVTPTGGVILDPFLGSGTTALAAEMEGFAWIGIEREAEYVAIAEARLNGVQKGLGLDIGAQIPDATYLFLDETVPETVPQDDEVA